MDVRQAFQKHYADMQAHHQAEAEAAEGHSADCETLSDCAKAAGDSKSAKAHGAMAKRFAASAGRHKSDSEAYGTMQKTVATMTSKAMHDPNEIVPDGVQRIALNADGVRAVPRAGQPAAADRLTPVPVQFEKLFAVEEGW